MVRTRLATIGLVLVLLAGTVTVGSAPSPAGAVPAGVVPTQWIAQQYTELLGRAPSPAEWHWWMSYYGTQSACTADNLSLMTKAIAATPEFVGLYPTATSLDKATRLSAVVRAVTARDPNEAEWNAYFDPYLKGTLGWDAVVSYVTALSFGLGGTTSVCNPAKPSRGFTYSRPLDLRAKVGLGASRTQAQLQQALNAAASGTTPAARTVSLLPGEVVRVGGAGGGNQGLTIPTGVTLTTQNMAPYSEPAIGAAPKALAYARMGRIVANTTESTTYPHPTDGRTCTLWFCQNTGMVRLSVGSKLSGVWVNGQGTGDTNSKIALVETAGSTPDNPTSVTASRLSEPGRDGAGLRLHGNSAGTPCTDQTVTGNLITAYSSLHQFDQSGQAQWADGIIVSCEEAKVSSNSIVDVTDAAILVLGSFNRAQNKTVAQRSQVFNNTIVSAGNDAHIALGADAVGICNSDRNGLLIPCIDQFEPRDMAGSRIYSNTFWTGPRTSFDIGLMVGGAAMWGDHKILNAATTPTGTPNIGTVFHNNTTGPVGQTSARVNIAVDIGDMTNAWILANTLTTPDLVDGNPRLSFNKCPRAKVVIGPDERTAILTDLPLPPPTAPTSRGCLIGEPPPEGPERIRINTDGTGFEGTNTRRPFKVWGGGLHYPAPFNETVDNLREIRRMGANTARILIELEDFIGAPACTGCDPEVDQAALNNLANIATAAAQTGIYLDITGIGMVFHHSLGPAPFTSWYDSLGTTGDAKKQGEDEQLRWQAQTMFWSAVAKKLKNHNSILLYDLVNEPVFAARPGAPTSNWCFVTFAGGCFNQSPVKTLQDPTNPAITRTTGQVIHSWLSGMRQAIRDHDPETLITVGLIGPYGSAPTDRGCPGVYNKTALDPHVDLMAPHFYPYGASVDANIRQTAECKIEPNAGNTRGKPLIVEEFASFDPLSFETNPEDFDRYLAGTASISSGYITHFSPQTPSQLNESILATTDKEQKAYGVYLLHHSLFLRHGYSQSPAGQGAMAY